MKGVWRDGSGLTFAMAIVQKSLMKCTIQMMPKKWNAMTASTSQSSELPSAVYSSGGAVPSMEQFQQRTWERFLACSSRHSRRAAASGRN